jgi:hypothetical protein
MILAVAIDGNRKPACSEMWLGNTAGQMHCTRDFFNRIG